MGVGRSTYKTLLKYGIRTIGHLAQTDAEFLRRKLGKKSIYAASLLGDLGIPMEKPVEITMPSTIFQ